jgi:hypothetical protein
VTDGRDPLDAIDWSLATWEGSRREQLRRWSALPLERVIAALEEMDALSRALAAAPPQSAPHTEQD